MVKEVDLGYIISVALINIFSYKIYTAELKKNMENINGSW